MNYMQVEFIIYSVNKVLIALAAKDIPVENSSRKSYKNISQSKNKCEAFLFRSLLDT